MSLCAEVEVTTQVFLIRRVGIAHVPVPKLLQTKVTWAMPTLQEAEQLHVKRQTARFPIFNGRKQLLIK